MSRYDENIQGCCTFLVFRLMEFPDGQINGDIITKVQELFLTDVPPRPSQSNHLRLIHLTTFASLTQPPMSPWFYHLWNLSLAGECALLHQTAQEDSDKKLMSSTWPTNSPDSNMIKHQRDVFDQVQSMENSPLIWLGSDPSRRGYRTFWGVLWCLEVRH